MTARHEAPTRTVGGRGRRPLVAITVIAALSLVGCTGSSRPASADRSPHPSSPSPRPSTVRPTAAAHPSPSPSAEVAARVSTKGRVIVRAIGGPGGFRARPAYIYLPPAYFAHPTRRLPVLEMLHGTPGAPDNWVGRGDLRTTADAFADAHAGRAPIVVMPDINGSWSADSECIRTASGADVERYLTEDVVAYVRTAFRSAVGRESWWLAGASEGGLCAAMLALRHPSTYSSFGDLSGLSRPRVEHVSAAESIRQLYGNDRTAEREHDVIWLLQHRRYPAMRGWFECGADDTEVRRDQAAVVAAASAAGIPVHAGVQPGRHGWSIWRGSLRRLLPWLWEKAPA